jgi:hypothetical protein
MPVMNRRSFLQSVPAAALLSSLATADENSTTVYELRIYHAVEGRLDDLLARFRDHTMALFEKHGIKSLAYWTPTDHPAKGKTLVYILEHPSREEARANWRAFQDDPEWKSIKALSEANGPLVVTIDSTFMGLTDWSPRL